MNRPRHVMRRIPQKVINVTAQRDRIQHDQETIALKNQMVRDVITSSNVEKQNGSVDITPFMIPVNAQREPEINRSKVTHYLIITPSCIHDVHTYSAETRTTLEERNVYFIELSKYGVTYPIVSASRLIYCKKCFKDENNIVDKSIEKGNLNFYVPKGLKHAKVPDYVEMNEPVFTHGDNVWVNLMHSDFDIDDPQSVRDLIVSKTHRKNFHQVFSLQPPYHKLTDEFGDFGTVTFLSLASKGYDSDAFIIQDTLTDDEYDDMLDDDIVIQKPIKKPSPVIEPIISVPPPIELVDVSEPIVDPIVVVKDEVDHDSSCPPILFEVPSNDVSAIVLNMQSINDFNNNNLYFKQHYDIDVALATYDSLELSVNLPSDIIDERRDFILNDLKRNGYNIYNERLITIFVNGTMIKKHSFVISSIQVSVLNDCQILDVAKETALDVQDREIVNVLTILEKACLNLKHKNIQDDVIINFEIPSACKHVSDRDVKYLFKHGFCSEWNYFDKTGDHHKSQKHKLAIGVLLMSDLIAQNCQITENSIVVKVN